VDSASKLGRAQAEDMERFLQEQPDDLDTHKRLLIFYTRNGTRFYDPSVATPARHRHELWMIEHHPEDPILSTPDGVPDPSEYAQVNKLWQALVAKPGAPAAILGNAAAALAATDLPAAEKLLQEAHRLDPQGPWQLRGDILDAASKRTPPVAGPAAAYDEGDFDGARKKAKDALKLNAPDSGAAIFEANMVLGLLAMRSGDRKSAIQFLQAAGNAPSSSELAYFEAPITYRLPSWLLKDGERESVIQFLERFAKTSIVDRDILLQSADLIRKNQKPIWYPQLDVK
jgi:tetratricopeptide (TPR) repeat protein